MDKRLEGRSQRAISGHDAARRWDLRATTQRTKAMSQSVAATVKKIGQIEKEVIEEVEHVLFDGSQTMQSIKGLVLILAMCIGFVEFEISHKKKKI